MVLNAEDPLIHAPSLDRSEIYVPPPIVDLFETDVFARERVGDAHPVLLPASTAVAVDESDSLEFKLKAVKLTQLAGVQVQDVAEALEIHPFMLSKWRKGSREGTLRGRAELSAAVKAPTPREVTRYHALKRAHALLRTLIRQWWLSATTPMAHD
ncbi:MAG: transposase [Vicinamibacterales bacterium]|nr:transposase [Vicinamibacterales bacterium]